MARDAETNKMWEIIDTVIKEVIKDNEAIRTYGTGVDVTIDYSIINDNKLTQHKRTLDQGTLLMMTTQTLRTFILEVIAVLRSY